MNLVTRKADTVHVSRIYPFLYDPEVIDPENVAIRDQGEFIGKDIVDALRDRLLPKTRWSVKVRWARYDESFDEWNQLRDVEALHKYLRRNNLAKFIPKSGQILEDKPLRRTPVVRMGTIVEEVVIPTKGTKRNRRDRKKR